MLYPSQDTITLPRDVAQAYMGTIVATNVSHQEYMEKYAQNFCEWIEGTVIKLPPITLEDDTLKDYTRSMLKMYLNETKLGRVVGAPFVMRLFNRNREPDLQVILGDNLANLKQTFMQGAADICIEITSQGTSGVDYGAKRDEYEYAGVKEYWQLNAMQRQTLFHRLNAEGVYDIQEVKGDIYTTPLLPKFQLHIPTLWRLEYPSTREVLAMIAEMLGE